VIGQLVGPGLIWARGRFDLKTIQVNKYNQLTFEIHSKLLETVPLSKIFVRFNDPMLNFELTGSFALSKKTPLTFTRELYISKENSFNREFIQLVEFIIEVAPSAPQENNNVLQFALKPYCTPQENLIDVGGIQ
jgi:hypothetical protein